MIRHHPEPELLMQFSAGSLPLSHALCVSTHIESCSTCQTNLHRLTSMGASVFESLEPIATPASLKASVLDLIKDQPNEQDAPIVKPKAVNPNTQIPRCLQQFIADDYEALKWRFVSLSVRAATLCTDINGANVELLRIKPGAKIGRHTHTNDEYTIVLKGSFSDESGIYKKGDFVIRDQRHNHQPTVSRDSECICLAVTDGPIEFTGWLGKLFNPFVRKSFLTS
jgi:putative transcriptional regulator